ncbi:Dlt1p [Sugiyamaella lignohabitans]|uniref:Defect at low temperature protein 1 n=1 Tax=Sugiyamaella lignohabitans TaxID=796027 RepID=A0A167CDA1_9ASCO|nr:Dlt1p [Sugiyamaella lignohabitans]ANB11540.1 Dlt1p [Sugiyamaella lignohabitans]
MAKTYLFIRQKATLQGWLYRISLICFLSIFIALLVATPIDVVHQSGTSGQFWDAIIVLIAYALTVVIAIFLYLVRLIQVRTSLSDIPRRYVMRKDDVSERCASRIRSELARCATIVEETLPQSEDISHPGLRNPDFTEGSMDIPYEEIAAACSTIVELKSKSLHPTFVRPRGMPLREYLILLESYDLLDWSEHTDMFLDLHEKARFSAKPLEEDEFNDYIESTIHLLYSIKVREELKSSVPATGSNISAGLANGTDSNLGINSSPHQHLQQHHQYPTSQKQIQNQNPNENYNQNYNQSYNQSHSQNHSQNPDQTLHPPNSVQSFVQQLNQQLLNAQNQTPYQRNGSYSSHNANRESVSSSSQAPYPYNVTSIRQSYPHSQRSQQNQAPLSPNLHSSNPTHSRSHSQVQTTNYNQGNPYSSSATGTSPYTGNSPALTPWDFHNPQYTTQPTSCIHSRDNSSLAASPLFTGHPHPNRHPTTGLYPLSSLSQTSGGVLLSPSRTRQSHDSQDSDVGSVIIHYYD